MKRRRDRFPLVALLALGVAAGARAQVLMDRPVSVAWHQATDAWYVADLGSETEPGGRIARLDRRDKRAQPRWLTGFTTPRALAAWRDLLYVADGVSLVVIDATKAAVLARHRIDGARLLGGIAVGPDGEAYVSDILSNALHRVSKAGKSSLVLRGGGLEGPAGLFLDGKEILVANLGAVSDPGTLATRGPGHLAAVDLKTGKVRRVGPSLAGRFESVLRVKDEYLLSDSAEGTVKILGRSGEVRILRRNLKGGGGLGLDSARGLLAVPETGSRSVLFVTLP